MGYQFCLCADPLPFCLLPLLSSLNHEKEAPCIHCGFDKAYNESGLSRSLCEAMANAQLETLFITSHSLSGALMVLATLDLASKTTAGVPLVLGNIHVNTLGAPRVGNQTFAAHVEKVHHNKIPERQII